MSAAVGNVNKATHHAVVDLAAGYLQQAGFDVTPRPYREKISDTLADGAIDGDVRGLEGVYMNVSSRLNLKLHTDLDRARIGADIAGKPVGCFIQWRGDRGVGDAYVVLSLRDLARLMGGTPPP